MQSHDNILSLQGKFDTFLFDAFGVLYDGSKIYDGAKEALETLIKSGKNVYILSNTTAISSVAEDTYKKKGLIKGQHFHKIITAGEHLRELLLNKNIKFTTKTNPKKYFIFGKENKPLFENVDYVEVDDVKDADFVYLSTIRMSNEEYLQMSDEYKKMMVHLSKSKDNEWSLLELDPLIPKINDIIIKSGLPVLSSNPDYRAIELVDGFTEKMAVITPGSIAKYLKENGVEVVETGKPYKTIYDYAFDVIKHDTKNATIDKSKICMVGDTLRTDIKGANNAEIKGVLCVETGITAKELKDGEKLENLIAKEKVLVEHTIKSVG